MSTALATRARDRWREVDVGNCVVQPCVRVDNDVIAGSRHCEFVLGGIDVALHSRVHVLKGQCLLIVDIEEAASDVREPVKYWRHLFELFSRPLSTKT